MASVHRTMASSGATKVSVVEYVGAGRYEVLAYLGSSKDPAEVVVLEERAREMLADPLQGVLDFGIEVPRRVVAVRPVMSGGSAAVGVPVLRPSREVAPAARVRATGSRVLYDAVVSVYSSLGFDVLDDKAFRDLVVARVVNPASIRKTPKVLKRMVVGRGRTRRCTGRCRGRRRMTTGRSWRASASRTLRRPETSHYACMT